MLYCPRSLFYQHASTKVFSYTPMPYISADSLRISLSKLHGTADHMMKIWWALKQMGMTITMPVEITTVSPTPALQRLFAFGHPDGAFFIPFAHTTRLKTMKSDAARSIVQTNIRRWHSSGSVVGVDPTSYLEIQDLPSGALQVRPRRNYPIGLGFGKSGFALDDNTRVGIPDTAFAVWYYRQAELASDEVSRDKLRQRLTQDLLLTAAEAELIFVDDDWQVTLQDTPLTDAEVYQIAMQSIDAAPLTQQVIHQTLEQHTSKVRSMVTAANGPTWLNADPRAELEALVQTGAKAILLYGPPRTSKTHAIDALIPRDSPERETIQIHNGWGYDDLMVGLRPEGERWNYKPGPLLKAIREQKLYIVLEEINRTEFSQAIGEVFSLLEEGYRGEQHKIRLRDGEEFYIPETVLVMCTMNTLDRSTEEVDDALFGRMAAVEFPPRVEDLQTILDANGVTGTTAEKIRELFATILRAYPLGHGYFAGFKPDTRPINYYRTRIRPVLQKHLQNYRDDALRTIDEKVNQLFNA